MARGLEAIKAAQASDGKKVSSIRTYLKKGESLLVRIPETVLDTINVKQVVSVWEPRILPTLAYKANGITDKRDLFDEALELMKADHFKAIANGEIVKGSEEDKKSYRNSLILQPKPTYLFSVIPLVDFTQGKATFPAGTPIILETNNGKNGANIEALISTLQNLERKFNTKAFTITATGSNTFSITPEDLDDDRAVSKEALKVFKATKSLETLPEELKEFYTHEYGKLAVKQELFDNALFEANEENQLGKLKEIGFDVTRLEGINEPSEEDVAEAFGTSDEDLENDGLPF